jgi:hypothetical protein
VGQRIASIRKGVARQRAFLARLAFELVVVFAGVSAAFALENFRLAHEEAQYRHRMVGALRASLDDWAFHGAQIDRTIAAMLRSFDQSAKEGGRAALPIYRESGAERPPTRAWDGIVATGAARALDPDLFFRLARFYSRADSFGDRYLRYNAFSESRVLPHAAQPDIFYKADGRTLQPEFAAYVERLGDLDNEERRLVAEAAELRDRLPRD